MDDSEAYLNLNQPFSNLSYSSPSGSVTDTSFYDTASEDEGMNMGMNSLVSSPWLTSIAKTVGKGIDGIARGAKSILNELAELENEALRADSIGHQGDGDDCHRHHNKRDGSDMSGSEETMTVAVLPLPWEICIQSTDADLKVSIVQKEDAILKQRIFDLSSHEHVFAQPFTEHSSSSSSSSSVSSMMDDDDDHDSFRLDDARVMLIRRLLETDSRLGQMHAKISGRSVTKETLFWQNFFFHCEKLREERQKEINDENLRRATHDDELDAELVGRPPASCTGFYPRTGKLHACDSLSSDVDVNASAGVSVNADMSASARSSSSRYVGHIVPSIQNCDSGEDGFVVVDEDDVF